MAGFAGARSHLSVLRCLMWLRSRHAVMTPATAANTRMRPGPHCPPMMQTTPSARATRASAKDARARRVEALGASPGNGTVFSSPESKGVINVKPPYQRPATAAGPRCAEREAINLGNILVAALGTLNARSAAGDAGFILHHRSIPARLTGAICAPVSAHSTCCCLDNSKTRQSDYLPPRKEPDRACHH